MMMGKVLKRIVATLVALLLLVGPLGPIWGAFSALTFADNSDPMAIFTPEERAWLEANPVIKVGPDSDYAPVEFYENDMYKGLSIDYLSWISSTYGINFEFVRYPSWAAIMEALKGGEIQLQSGIIKTPARQGYLDFTEPYSDMPTVLMIRKDFTEKLSNETLFDYRVGVIDDFAVEEYIRTKYKPENLMEFANVKVALEALSKGQVDVMVLDIGQATYYVEKMGLTNIKITNDVTIDFAIQLSFGAPKGPSEGQSEGQTLTEPMLISILDKALEAMPRATRQELANKWLGIGYFTQFDYKWLKPILGVLGALTLLFFVVSVWLLTLRKKDRQLQVVNKQLQVVNGQLEDLNQELENQIHALSATQRQLVESEKINGLSRLAVGIAHEINTPLGTGISATSYIQTLAAELLGGYEKLSRAERDEILEQLSHSGDLALQTLQRAAQIIRDFLAVAGDQQDIELREVDISQEIAQIATLLSEHETMKCQLSLRIEPNIHAMVSVHTLFQILTALMENSFLHGYNKQVGPVEIALVRDEEYIELTFKDFGLGITEEELPNVFEPFYSTKHGTEKRLGLGLFSVYNLVTHNLKGQISISSQPQKGTVFTIKINV